MPKPHGKGPERIAMLGSMPPIRALSSYCLEFALAIAEICNVEFISFKKIYPAFLYPGGDLKNDHTFPALWHPNLNVRQHLTWYNPVTWVIEGIFTKGELLHAQWWSLPLSLIYIITCLLFRLRHKPVVFTVHNISSHEKSFFYTTICRILFKLGDHFIVHSAQNRAQLIKYYSISPERVTQIPHGPLDFHLKSDIDRDEIRTEMGFDAENRIILLFGAIRPYKGVDTALNAFKMVLTEITKARLLIVGKLWEAWNPYQQLIEKLGIRDYVKTYLQYVPYAKVSMFFVASDLVIIPYHHFDSQSGVGAAAVSYHKPMIVSDVGGLPELVLDKCNVVPPKDPSALANAIKGCLFDRERLVRMTEDAKIVAEKIAWPSIAQKTWSVYRTVLDKKKTSGEY
jgi:glycosyltransferase involved in cell wall biosynthesis